MAPEEVEGNDDLLVIILVKLPARSIFRFTRVSKRWKNTISTPFFLQTYHNIRKAQKSRMLAYIQTTGECINMLPVSPSNDHSIDTSVKLDLRFVNLSNGLILCQSIRPPPILQYHIINPLTNKSVSLPPNKVLKYPIMALVCEENAGDLILSYKVIAAKGWEENTFVIETFSSNTWEWTTSKLKATGRLGKGLLHCNSYTLVVNGIIHWCTLNHVVVYDSNQDNTETSIQMIQLPCHFNENLRFARSSRDDPLWLCMDIEMCVKIWMLTDIAYDSYRKQSATMPEREWVLMHSINYQPMCMTILFESEVCYPKSWRNSVASTFLAGLVPWESPLVALLKIDKLLIFWCNLESMTFEQVQYPVPPVGINSYAFHPYMEPLYLSSFTF